MEGEQRIEELIDLSGSGCTPGFLMLKILTLWSIKNKLILVYCE